MLHLRRLRFESVGHPAARFAPLELRFDSNSLPGHAILWLRNGGGKSSMLNLLFALLRPDRREFLGVAEEGKDRRLGDYVRAQDTAHVAAEWGQLGEHQPARVTGMVLEWQDRARSIDDSRLRRLWYAFVPADARSPGLFEPAGDSLRFETLPFVDDGRRLTLGQFRDRLREAQRADPSLELVMPGSQSEWRRHLEDIHLDPEAFRYQLQMNREEGGANQLFRRRCRTDAGFVDLLLELAVPVEQPGKVADVYARYAEQLGRRPQVERQRAFLVGAFDRLGPLADASSTHAEAVAALDVAAHGAAGLRAALEAAADRDAQEGVRQQQRARALEAQALEEDSRRSRLTGQAAEARRRAAGFRLEEAVAAHEEAQRAEAGAGREEAAWTLVGSLAARRTAAAELDAVTVELERVEAEAEPLRRERDAAATALAARLITDEQALLAEAATAEGETAEALSAAEAAAAERLRAVGEAARAEAELSALRARRESCAQSRRAAEREGLLEPGEEPAAALSRLESELASVEAGHADAETQLAEVAQAWEAGGRRLSELRGRLDQATARALRAGHAVDELEAAAARLVGVPRLAEVAETSQIVLWETGESLAAQLDALAERADRLLVGEELEAAEDRHALAALEVDTLLPARRDVEAALAALAEAGIAAAPGWRFIADSVPASGRAAAIAARPELADGVVVLDPDRLEAARAALAEQGLRPASALAVGPSTLLGPDGGADARRFVLPAAEALYDRVAGEAERDVRAGRLEGVDARTAAVRAARDRDAALAARVRDLLTAYPPDDRARLHQEAAAAAAAAQELEAEVVACEAERRDLERRRGDLTARARTLSVRARDLAERVAGLRPLLAQAVTDAADAVREPELAGVIRRLREAEHTAERAEHDARQLARRLTEAASSRRHAADRCAHRRRDLALPDPGAAGVPDEPADVLERRYRVLDERYRQQVTDAVLEERRARAQADLTRLDSEIARAPAEAGERAALLLGTPDGREETARAVALRVAQEQLRAAIARRGAAESQRLQAQRTFEALPAGRELPPDRRPCSAQEADGLAEDLAEEARLSSGLVTDLRKQADEAQRRAQEAQLSSERLAALVATLDGALRRVAGVAQVRAPALGAFDGDGTAAADPARAAVEVLQAAADREEAARGEVARRAAALQRFVRERRFDDLEGPLRDRLGADEPAVLAPRAPAYAADVTVRLAQCEQKLAELDAHRDLLVKEIASAVERALHVLRQAERASVVPDGFGDWSGQRFLHIRFTAPERDEELFARLAGMVDAMADEVLRPEGRALLQRATHAAVGQRGFAVTILKPTPALRAERVPVSDLATFSGGEQVTAAILLYCTLAVLRARARGQRRAGGLLVLDNPIGKSSNVTLLELQRRVADGMGVQLLYTTAVDDRDAVGVFPQWIRLRNDRADRRTGAQHVEVDDRDLGAVTAARLWRRPER